MICDGPLAGKLLRRYDPDAREGRGEVVGTSDLSQAMTFPSAIEAMELWKRPSTVVPLRPDGKPNRPLSAFTITVCDAEQAAEQQRFALRLRG